MLILVLLFNPAITPLADWCGTELNAEYSGEIADVPVEWQRPNPAVPANPRLPALIGRRINNLRGIGLRQHPDIGRR